ncbi:hypothetical protein E4U43_008695 [Claviceps pusilla]|uniref:Uncharacterized protein n=1 Tax=Claviceps pusilla TaxID=123648 RepID=A0A9P7NBF4_9HYPO|nr:hypothetical protein E4U43_008695 [Claviceps pusilla]
MPRIPSTQSLRPTTLLRLRQPRPQPRLYTSKPDVEPAEFTASKRTSNTTKYFFAGATVLVLGFYATMAGSPRQVAKAGLENDPEAVKEFIPPHGAREAGAKKT